MGAPFDSCKYGVRFWLIELVGGGGGGGGGCCLLSADSASGRGGGAVHFWPIQSVGGGCCPLSANSASEGVHECKLLLPPPSTNTSTTNGMQLHPILLLPS